MSAAKKSQTVTLGDALVAEIEKAARHNRSDVAPPVAILWTDRERRWERIVPKLRDEAPEVPILTLGSYDPENLTGPAIWLRCAIAGTLPDIPVGEGVPVLYLPGVGKSDLRAVESCPKRLQPLAELQYRGALFTHKNGRDMTPAGFLSGTLGVEVAPDRETADALVRTLPILMAQTTERLIGMSPVKATSLDELLVEDIEREILTWMDDPDGYRRSRNLETLESFRRLCRGRYGFDPFADGRLRAANLLVSENGAWGAIWRRFTESHTRYENLPGLLDRAEKPVPDTLFESAAPYRPRDNRAEEDELREDLLALSSLPADEARKAIIRLEESNGRRRSWIWSRRGESPLALALLPLSELCSLTKDVPVGESPEEIAASYAKSGWQTDDAALRALETVESGRDTAAVSVAVRSTYRDWLESSASRFQAAVAKNPVVVPQGVGESGPEAGVCILFVDGLRYDLARRLSGLLENNGTTTDLGWRFTALPGVTPTAKPLVSPAAPEIGAGEGFESRISGSKVTARSLRKAIATLGYDVLDRTGTGDPAKGAWTEYGDIDNLGHERGSGLAREVERSLASVAERIAGLLAAGWREVRVVTDHGWLLLPGGLPKVELPEHLTATRKGRCARLEPDAATNYQTVPWSLDAEVRVAVAPGIGVFEGTDEYEHGGLSPQECVVPLLKVTSPGKEEKVEVNISSVRWTGFRCKVQVEGDPEDVRVDLRTSAADSGSSICPAKKPKSGVASLLVADDALEGRAVLVVLTDGGGEILAQQPTVVGG